MWVHHMSQVSHLLTVLSCSVNFYIYLAKHGEWKWNTARADMDVGVNFIRPMQGTLGMQGRGLPPNPSWIKRLGGYDHRSPKPPCFSQLKFNIQLGKFYV